VLFQPAAFRRAQSPYRKTYFWTKLATIFDYFVNETNACSNFAMTPVSVTVF
jgi:hypothetical protein